EEETPTSLHKDGDTLWEERNKALKSEERWEHVDNEEWEDVEDDVYSSVSKSEHLLSGLIYEDDTELVLPSGHRSLWNITSNACGLKRNAILASLTVSSLNMGKFWLHSKFWRFLAIKGSQVK
ncbi:9940_t:CDS:2, partial [Acaulospora colombiana]